MELGYKSPDTYCVVLFNKLLGEGTKQQLALSYRQKINYSHCFLFSKCNFFLISHILNAHLQCLTFLFQDVSFPSWSSFVFNGFATGFDGLSSAPIIRRWTSLLLFPDSYPACLAELNSLHVLSGQKFDLATAVPRECHVFLVAVEMLSFQALESVAVYFSSVLSTIRTVHLWSSIYNYNS